MSLIILKNIFEEFNKNQIKYCVLRNYEFLLNSKLPIESLDTVIAKEDIKKAETIFRNNGFLRRKQQFSLAHRAYFKLGDKLERVSFDVQIGGVHWNDLRYIDESILKNRIKKDYFYVPSDNDYFVMLLVHSILGKRRFKPKYQKILMYLNIDKEYVLGNLSKIFNKRIAFSLLNLVKNNKFEKIKIKHLLFYFIIKKPVHILKLLFLFFRWLKWKRLFKPAPLISILGPDGSGKSSLTAKLNSFLQESGRKCAVIYTGRGRGHLLPISKIGMKYKRIEKSNASKNKEINNKLKKRIIYTLASPVFSLDLWLRYWFKIYPQRLNKKIVITDRYCSDIILMKNVNFKFKRLLLKLFPKPTLSILLYNDSKILHKRRPEESVKELERQMHIFDQMNYSLKIKTVNKEKDSNLAIKFVVERLLWDWW